MPSTFYLEPVVDETFFVNLQHQPDIFMRLRCWGSSLVGVSVKPASVRLGTRAPAPDAMRQLAAGLVAQYGQMEHEEISRHQYKAVHKLGRTTPTSPGATSPSRSPCTLISNKV